MGGIASRIATVVRLLVLFDMNGGNNESVEYAHYKKVFGREQARKIIQNEMVGAPQVLPYRKS